MVVKDVGSMPNSPLFEAALSHNLSVFSGKDELGKHFEKAKSLASPYAGVIYVEALINTQSGKIEEILYPSATRVYEKEVCLQNGRTTMVPVSLSQEFPEARLAVFILDARPSSQDQSEKTRNNAGEILDVIARDEILPEARACLRESVIRSKTSKTLLKKAA